MAIIKKILLSLTDVLRSLEAALHWMRQLVLGYSLTEDERFNVLVRHAKDYFKRNVVFDDEYLKQALDRTEGRTNAIRYLGTCDPRRGGNITLSTSLRGDDCIFTLLHELGHALDFQTPGRNDEWNLIWKDGTLSLDARQRAYMFEMRANYYGTLIADVMGIGLGFRWKLWTMDGLMSAADTYGLDGNDVPTELR